MAHKPRHPDAEGPPRSVDASAALARIGRSLRSVREYDDADVGDDLVLGWLETARWSGSSRNSQPWRFVLVRDPATRAELSLLGDSTAHLGRAPLVVVVAAVEGPFPFSTAFDLGRVSHSLMLGAAADGICSCVGVFEPADNIARARQLLGIRDPFRVELAIAFGRPAGSVRDRADPGTRSPRGRLSLSDLVSWEWFGGPPITPSGS
jgi:nitroreductase